MKKQKIYCKCSKCNKIHYLKQMKGKIDCNCGNSFRFHIDVKLDKILNIKNKLNCGLCSLDELDNIDLSIFNK